MSEFTGKFATRCREAAKKVGVEIFFYREDKRRTDAHEDDGNLHIQQGFIRASFDVSSNDDVPKQNRKTREILAELGLAEKKDGGVISVPTKLAERTLVEEEPEPCPTCGCTCGGY